MNITNRAMIATYSDYIETYILTTRRNREDCPGEHHFVATYLLPRIYSITQRVPAFVNPDGTKRQKMGDIVYNDPRLAIEVKFETVHLTTFQFVNWIALRNPAEFPPPDIFIGVASKGIVVSRWEFFRRKYQEINEMENILPGINCGPQLSINRIIGATTEETSLGKFLGANKQTYEVRFIGLLNNLITTCHR